MVASGNYASVYQVDCQGQKYVSHTYEINDSSYIPVILMRQITPRTIVQDGVTLHETFDPLYNTNCLGLSVVHGYKRVWRTTEEAEQQQRINEQESIRVQRLNNLAEWKRGSLDADTWDALELIEELESKNNGRIYSSW